MPSILNNVSALAASRQLGVTGKGLASAIERLTTGKRINRASDDAAGMSAGTGFQQTAKTAANAVKVDQNSYYAAQSQDAFLEEATNQALRMAELEGSGNSTSGEYTTVKGLVSAAVTASGQAAVTTTNSSTALSGINASRATLASTMATAQSNANIDGIKAENNTSQADTIMAADISAEMVNLTKFQILNQAGVSALTQANQSSQTVLGLFR
jgi:flagellin